MYTYLSWKQLYLLISSNVELLNGNIFPECQLFQLTAHSSFEICYFISLVLMNGRKRSHHKRVYMKQFIWMKKKAGLVRPSIDIIFIPSVGLWRRSAGHTALSKPECIKFTCTTRNSFLYSIIFKISKAEIS